LIGLDYFRFEKGEVGAPRRLLTTMLGTVPAQQHVYFHSVCHETNSVAYDEEMVRIFGAERKALAEAWLSP
jgi:hypothetical protein